MSSGFMNRVKRIERRVTAPGACKECGGLLRAKMIMEHDPLPDPCSRCGRDWVVVRIVRAVPPEGWKPREYSEEPLD